MPTTAIPACLASATCCARKYTADAGGTIYCLDADTGAVCWTHKTAPVWSSPLVADGKVYVGTHGRGLLVFEHGRTKTLLSQNMRGGDIVASPAAANGVLYVASQKHLYAIQLGKTGGLVSAEAEGSLSSPMP